MGLVAVADGMGGHRAGEVASATALEALRAAITGGRPLRESIEDANDAVFTKSLTDTEPARHGHHAHRGHARAPAARCSSATSATRARTSCTTASCAQVTADHSLVEELVREGRLTADEAAVHPQRSIITRALGVDASVEVDVYPVELAPGDRLLLCSDGLTGMVQTDDIAATLRREDDPTRAAHQLVDAANAAGGEDNITVVVVAVTDEAPLRAVPEPIEPIEAVRQVDDEPRTGTGRTTPAWRCAASGACCCGRCRSCSCSASRSAAVGWYARKDYYVGVDQGRVTVFKGVPGGLAGWDPTIEQRTDARARRPAAGRRRPR